MRRREWFAAIAVAIAGCGTTTRPKGKSARGRKKPRGPQTMGGLLIDGYVADLGDASAAKRAAAAKELGAMGAAAKSALPALERVAKDADATAARAARDAIASIRKSK